MNAAKLLFMEKKFLKTIDRKYFFLINKNMYSICTLLIASSELTYKLRFNKVKFNYFRIFFILITKNFSASLLVYRSHKV